MCICRGDGSSLARLALGLCVAMTVTALGQSNEATSPALAAGGTSFQGSTIVSNPSDFQPELVYKKFSATEPVAPGVQWQLSFGALLDTAPASIAVTLSLDPAGQNADIQIVDGIATFLIQGTLHNNYDPSERFEILYTGALDPFVGPIDFLLEPDGLPVIPVRVHLNLIEQPGFPVPFLSTLEATAPLGDIAGDENMEIVASGSLSGLAGLYAFDQAGTVLSGWPFRFEDPEIVGQSYSSPALVDLDQDGKNEIVVVGFIQRNVLGAGTRRGIENTISLFAIEGSGALRWQVSGTFIPFSSTAVADLDGDAGLDIVVGDGANLLRYDQDGMPLAGWLAETPNDIYVDMPVIADVDGIPGNGLEIVACASVPGSPGIAQMYIWNQDGSLHDPAWPKLLESCRAPAVVDLDDISTNGLELVMAIDHAVPDVDPGTGFLNTFTVFAWHADGTDVSGWPHRFWRNPITFPDDRVLTSPSVADIDGDGDMEVVVSTYGQGDQANGNLFVFHHDGTLDPNWPQWAGTAQTPSARGGTALGDLDNDGLLEIVTASLLGVYAFRADGSPFEGFPRLTTDNFAQAMIADIDGDGRLEIVEASLFSSLSAWKMLTPSPDSAPWPRYRHNPARTGTPDRNLVAPTPIPTASAAGLAVMLCMLLGVGVRVVRRATRESSN